MFQSRTVRFGLLVILLLPLSQLFRTTAISQTKKSTVPVLTVQHHTKIVGLAFQTLPLYMKEKATDRIKNDWWQWILSHGPKPNFPVSVPGDLLVIMRSIERKKYPTYDELKKTYPNEFTKITACANMEEVYRAIEELSKGKLSKGDWKLALEIAKDGATTIYNPKWVFEKTKSTEGTANAKVTDDEKKKWRKLIGVIAGDVIGGALGGVGGAIAVSTTVATLVD